MARNKYPEETVRLILDEAWKLFQEKGYEHTSLQDIIDRLGGLTKGAVYHHFKSKEEIFLAAVDRMFAQGDSLWDSIRDDKSLSAVEKLRRMLLSTIYDPREESTRFALNDLKKSPRLVVQNMENISRNLVPRYIAPVLEQGIREDTVRTSCPQELGETLLLLMNFLIYPALLQAEFGSLMRKVVFAQDLLAHYGLGDLLNEEMEEAVSHLIESLNQNQQRQIEAL